MHVICSQRVVCACLRCCRTGDDDVSEAEHGELPRLGEDVAGEQQLHRRVKVLRHGHHHVGAEHPEHVVDEQAALDEQGETAGCGVCCVRCASV